MCVKKRRRWAWVTVQIIDYTESVKFYDEIAVFVLTVINKKKNTCNAKNIHPVVNQYQDQEFENIQK